MKKEKDITVSLSQSVALQIAIGYFLADMKDMIGIDNITDELEAFRDRLLDLY